MKNQGIYSVSQRRQYGGKVTEDKRHPDTNTRFITRELGPNPMKQVIMVKSEIYLLPSSGKG